MSKKQRQLSKRECCVCLAPIPEGPAPYFVDWHLVDGALVATCSEACREKGGYDERKPRMQR